MSLQDVQWIAGAGNVSRCVRSQIGFGAEICRHRLPVGGRHSARAAHRRRHRRRKQLEDYQIDYAAEIQNLIETTLGREFN
jgi:hypothetical protein